MRPMLPSSSSSSSGRSDSMPADSDNVYIIKWDRLGIESVMLNSGSRNDRWIKQRLESDDMLYAKHVAALSPFIHSIEIVRIAAIESHHFRMLSDRKRFSGIQCAYSVGWLILVSICEGWLKAGWIIIITFLLSRFKKNSELNSRCLIRCHMRKLIMRIYARQKKKEKYIKHVKLLTQPFIR